ncbi:MAG: threonine-phosphate decarboxylase [Oscillatoriales cyanobacterium]|nr:MAG: threonine-phosphate decarboxylase [Oscillatoriales cyanobacterium]
MTDHQARPTHGGNLAWAAAIAQCTPAELLDFSASINPFGLPPGAIAAIQAAIPQLGAYPDPNYGELRSALALHHNLDPNWILPGNGAAELLTWAARDLAAAAAVVLPVPAFADYWRALRAAGARVLPIAPVEPWVWDWSDWLDQDCQQYGLLLNNPHNPTGQLWDLDTLQPLCDRFGWVVIDEAFMDFLRPEHQPSAIALVSQCPNLIVIRSLTKFYAMPGLRLGYAIAQPDQLRRWQQWRDPWSVNSLAVVAAIACLQDQTFAEQTWNWLATARSELAAGLAARSGLRPFASAANYLLVQTALPSDQLQQHLLRSDRVLIRDCLSFPELGDRFLRVAVRHPAENQRLLQAVAQVTG